MSAKTYPDKYAARNAANAQALALLAFPFEDYDGIVVRTKAGATSAQFKKLYEAFRAFAATIDPGAWVDTMGELRTSANYAYGDRGDCSSVYVKAYPLHVDYGTNVAHFRPSSRDAENHRTDLNEAEETALYAERDELRDKAYEVSKKLGAYGER